MTKSAAGFRFIVVVGLAVWLAFTAFFAAEVAAASISGAGEASDGAFISAMMSSYGLSRDDIDLEFTTVPTTAEAFLSYVDDPLIYFTTHGTLDAQLTSQGALAQFPLAGGALVVAYNIGVNATLGASAQLALSGATLARIWSGNITRWNDPAIIATNAFLNTTGQLPDADIVMAYTEDAAGGLGVHFLRYLCSFLSDPTACVAAGFAGFQPAVGARMTEAASSTARAQFVRATANSLTYLGLAEATGMNVAAGIRGVATRVQPTTAGITAAMTDSTARFNNLTSSQVLDLLTATSTTAWPMTYLIYSTIFAAGNTSIQCVLLNEYMLWTSWILLNDDVVTSATTSLHSIIPYDWKRTVLDSLSEVTCNGNQVSTTSYLVGMGSANPLPTLGRYYPASRFVLKYFIGNTDASVLSLVQGTIDFGQTSAPVSAVRLAQAPDIITVPVWGWGIAPSYHLPELIGGGVNLRMDWNLVSDIYLGHVTMWNDTKITDLNPSFAGVLPGRPIRIVYQSNRSVISLNFNTAISSRVPEYNATIGAVNHFDNSVAAQSSRGIPVNGFAYPQAINDNPYSFGLCSSQHLNRRVQPAAVMNTAGNWVTPSPDSVLSAIQDFGSQLDRITFYHAPGAQSWPIALLTAVTVRSRTMTDCAKAEVLVDWLYWMQTSEVGRDIIDSSNYMPTYPFDGYLNVLRQKLVNVTCRGVAVSSLAGCVNDDGRLCSLHGTCSQGRCTCDSGWMGDLCGQVASSASGSDTAETLGIVLGITLPVVALVLCFCVLAVVVLVLVLRRKDYRHNSEYFINVAELEMGVQLGQGGFGEVYRATWKGTEVAVKLMPQSAASNKEARESFAQEVAIMSTLRHPNTVLFMAACTKPPKLCIVMEYMALGSLYDLLHNELVPDIPMVLKLRMAHQAAKGMHFLHASDIVHRDLKSLNLLLDNKWNVKVADFGLTKFRDSVKHKGETMVGSVPWMAPEVLQEEPDIDFRLSDIYSFAVIMWEMLTRDHPYAGMAPPQVAVLVITNDIRPQVPNDLHMSEGERAFTRLMTKSWQRDAPMRPDFIEIMQTLVEIGNTHAGASSGMFGTTNSSSSGSSNPNHSSYTSFNNTRRSAGGSTGNKSGYSSTSSTQSVGAAAIPKLKALPRRDVTFIVCDLAEFDQVWQSSPSEADRAIDVYGSMIRKRCGEHLGHLFSLPSLHSGGTFMMSFADPGAAARFALALRRDVLAKKNARLDVSWRVSIDQRPGTCPPQPEDATRTGYEPRDYADACKLNTRCPQGSIVCSQAFAQRLHQSVNASALVRLVERADGSSRVLDPSEEDIEDQVAAIEDEENDRAEDGDDDDVREGKRRSGEETGICSSNACHWIINTDRIKLGDVIGEGNYGKVTEGNYFGTQVAIKRLFNSRLDDEGMRRMRKEAAILSNLDHPNIVKLIGLSIADTNLILVMELVPRGSLRSVLSSNVSLPWNKRLSMLRDAALGVEFLHSHSILHRDIKSSNLLVDDNWSVKVGDFGFATAKQDNATMTRCGTPCWTAPEILCPPQASSDGTQPPTKAIYTESADVYSFGIVMWEVLTRKMPYAEGNMMTVVSDVMGGKRPRVPADCPHAFAALVQRCWHRKPRKRPSMHEVLVHLNSELDSLPL